MAMMERHGLAVKGQETAHETPLLRQGVVPERAQEEADSADQAAPLSEMPRAETIDPMLCPVEVAARIIGQKWTLQIVKTLLNCKSQRFCELQEALGGVNPSTLSSRLKMLEDEGMIHRVQISAIPPHVEYSLTEMGCELRGVIQAISYWSRDWLCTPERISAWKELDTADSSSE
ncbi:MAG: helix-turn-helix transcriptional regulator [Caldilineaceae bacterium]|nr:helix-turn-helix transcriptional regulator [Caldilineaceae bacterium]